MRIHLFCVAVVVMSVVAAGATRAAEAPVIRINGDWVVSVGGEMLHVQPPETVSVKDEPRGELPMYDPAKAHWARGTKLNGVRAQECTKAGALIPESLVVTSADGKTTYEADKDFACDWEWGTLGRLAGGRIGEKQAVLLDYRYTMMRLDSVIRLADGSYALIAGMSHVANPALSAVVDGAETRVATIWISGRGMTKLTDAHVFPITADAYPKPAKGDGSVAEKLLPKTLKKLRAGEAVKIIAWGDSVTDGGYLQDKSEQWQAQFVKRLRERFPAAKIELMTEGWGGQSTASYFAVPPGQKHNFKESVLDVKPDLVISEFVNDAGGLIDEKTLDKRYGRIRDAFKEIGAEWVILTPHYVWPQWMPAGAGGKPFEVKGSDDDTRPYVKSLRTWAPKHHIALADASLRWGHLWRQGIPYTTLLLNTLNHPDGYGMSLFADSLMELFSE